MTPTQSTLSAKLFSLANRKELTGDNYQQYWETYIKFLRTYIPEMDDDTTIRRAYWTINNIRKNKLGEVQ